MRNRSLLATMMVLLFVCMSSSVFAQDAISLAMQGRKMTAAEVAALEKRVEQNPKAIDSRIQLLGYYSVKKYQNPFARKANQKHVLWLIENSPEAGILAVPYGQLDAIMNPIAYRQGKKAWQDQLKKDPENLKLLKNSANYFLLHDRELAKDSLQKAQILDPKNPKWPAALGQLYTLNMNSNSLQDKREAAKKALEQFEIAYKLSTERAQNVLLKSLANTALEAQETTKAKLYAEKMLNQIGSDWNSGNNVHYGNVILGKIALASEDIEEAKQRLLNAGKTSGSPQLNSFGPDMTLAKKLLQKGEKKVVLEYLTLCSQFWKLGKARLEKWSKIVKKDQSPSDWR